MKSINKKYYVDRRRNFVEKLDDDSIAVVASHSGVTRSHDTEYPFRQNSNFAYLTGFEEPDCVLLMSKIEGKAKSVLFLREKNELAELWDGKRLGLDQAPSALGVDEAYDIEELEQKLPEFLAHHLTCYSDYFHPNGKHDVIMQALTKMKNWRKKKQKLPLNFKYVNRVVEAMRLVKDEEEIALMKKAVSITDKAHRQAMAMTAEGVTEYQVQAAMEYIYRHEGGSGSAYGAIVASGDDANILHYVENDKTMNDGDLLLIDSGVEYQNYASDITRTFPVSGKFSEAQKKVYEAVLKVQVGCLEMLKPGLTFKEISDYAERELTQAMIDLGVFKKSVDEIIKEGLHKKYYPHGIGHWLGIDVHDQNPYMDEDLNDLKIEAGMVFTIEPGLYFPKKDNDLPEELKGIGVRIEDDVLMTKDGHDNLSANIPKTVEEVEKACSEKPIVSFN